MRIIYCGSGEFGIPCLEAIYASEHTLVKVFTQPAHPAGRGRKLRSTPVALWAQLRGVEFVETANINAPDVIAMIKDAKPDLMVVIAFGQKIGDEVIHLAGYKAVNVHASLLPKYRGAAPINWAILNDEKETGVSIITLAQRMDAGAVLAQAKCEIMPHETATELHDKLSQRAAPVLMETIAKIEAGTAVYQQQDESKVTLAPKLKKSSGFIDWTESAEKICNKIRGFWAWPEAESHYVQKKTGRCERVIFAQCQVIKSKSKRFSSSGMLDENLNVVCGEDSIRIVLIKPAGSGIMDFKSFVNGRATSPGDYFMQIEEHK